VIKIFLRPIKRLKVEPADKKLLQQLRKYFGLKPKNLELYKIALIHKSASTVISNGKKVNNERLEYLGDAILDAIVAEHLFSNFPNQNEGFLTKMRSRIVSRQSLNNLAIDIGLNRFVVTQTNNPLAHKHIFGDALEAFIGAIYLDKGYKNTNQWIVKHLFRKHVDLDKLQQTETDYKSRIIEWAQKHKYSLSFESSERENGKSSTPLFESQLFLNHKLMGSGFGTSKKEAEQNASLVAQERLDILFPGNTEQSEEVPWQN